MDDDLMICTQLGTERPKGKLRLLPSLVIHKGGQSQFPFRCCGPVFLTCDYSVSIDTRI